VLWRLFAVGSGWPVGVSSGVVVVTVRMKAV